VLVVAAEYLATSFNNVIDFLCFECRYRPIDRYADALVSYTRFAAVAQARVTDGNRAFCTVYIYTSVCVASAGQASLKKTLTICRACSRLSPCFSAKREKAKPEIFCRTTEISSLYRGHTDRVIFDLDL